MDHRPKLTCLDMVVHCGQDEFPHQPYKARQAQNEYQPNVESCEKVDFDADGGSNRCILQPFLNNPCTSSCIVSTYKRCIDHQWEVLPASVALRGKCFASKETASGNHSETVEFDVQTPLKKS